MLKTACRRVVFNRATCQQSEPARLDSGEVASIDAAAEDVVVVAGLSSGIAVDVVAASSLSRSA